MKATRCRSERENTARWGESSDSSIYGDRTWKQERGLMTFKSEKERQEALKIIADLSREATSDAQFRIYEQHRQEVLTAKICRPKKTGS